MTCKNGFGLIRELDFQAISPSLDLIKNGRVLLTVDYSSRIMNPEGWSRKFGPYLQSVYHVFQTSVYLCFLGKYQVVMIY